MYPYLLVGLGGFAGSVLRYFISTLTASWNHGLKIPLATFIVNIAGSFTIGLLAAYFAKNNLSGSNYQFLGMVGFCGGFTTFSAFSLDILTFIRSGEYLTGMVYIWISVFLCICFTTLGFFLVEHKF